MPVSCNVSLRDGDSEPKQISLVSFFFPLWFSSLCHLRHTPPPSPWTLTLLFCSILQARESSINQIGRSLGSLLSTNHVQSRSKVLLYVRLSSHPLVKKLKHKKIKKKRLKDPSIFISCDDFAIRFVNEKDLDRGPFVVFASESSSNSNHPLTPPPGLKKTLPLWSSWSRRNLPILRSCQVPQAGLFPNSDSSCLLFYRTLDTIDP